MRGRVAVAVAFAFLSGACSTAPYRREAGEAPVPAGQEMAIARRAFCTALMDREPLDPKAPPASFSSDMRMIYFWNAVNVARPPAMLRHRWYLDGKQVFELKIPLKHPSNRVWSYKVIQPGSWKVEAVGGDGRVLEADEFTVKAVGKTQ